MYNRFTPIGCKGIGNRKFEFVTSLQLLKLIKFRALSHLTK